MKAGLFAGGASWGAYWAGYHSVKKPIYDAYIGTSTGALIALFLALGRTDGRFYQYLLHEYSTTTNREMYGWFQPFNKNGKMNKVKLLAATIQMMRKDRNYIYDISKALESNIRAYFKPSHFLELRRKKIDVIVTVKNADVKKSRTEYVSILDEAMTYDRFIDYVVASASIPFFAKPRVINGTQYVDGGVLDPIPTEIIKDYEDVDIYLMHSLQDEQTILSPATTWSKLAANLFNDIRYEIKMDDVNKATNATVYHSIPFDWNSANFDSEKMKEAIRKGILTAKNS